MPAREHDPIGALGRYFHALEPEQRALLQPLLDPDDIALLERAVADVARAGWRATPLTLGVKLGALDPMPHTELLARKFVDAVEGISTRQIWNLPPQHGKSLIASQWGPVWALDRDPTIPLALTSYGDTLAERNSTAVRDLLVEHGDVLQVRLRRDQRRRDLFRTEQGGGLIAAGVGAALTGFGAQGIVVDDPFKDWQEAHSEARRLHVWNWYRAVVRTRLWDRPGRPGWIILVMTRWHEEDLTGMLLSADEAGDGEGWELVRLPAIAEENDLLGRKPGEPLAPMLFDLKALLARARAFGSYLTAGLEQQRPAPEEGTDIMRGWWRYDDMPPRYDDALTSWDMKLKDKEGGDFVVGQVHGRTGSDFWIADQLRGQWNVPTTKAAIALLAVRHPYAGRHVIENTGNGPEVMEELRKGIASYELSDDVAGLLGMTVDERRAVQNVLRRGMTGLVPENPKGDKRARMRAQTPKIEAGNVHLPRNAQWVPGFVDEMAAFPGAAAHDDQVDACSQGLKRLSNSGATAKGPPSRAPVQKPKPGARAIPRRPAGGRIALPRARGR